MSKIEKITDPRYEKIMQALNQIANELNVVLFKPNYHGKNHDPNTVLFYTREDAEHNDCVDKECVQYTAAEAQSLTAYRNNSIDERYVYRNSFWNYETTDVNNMINYDFANHGTIDLRGKDCYKTLKTIIEKALNDYKNVEKPYFTTYDQTNNTPVLNVSGVNVNGKIMDIQLNQLQIESIYRYQDNKYLLEDARTHLLDHLSFKLNLNNIFDSIDSYNEKLTKECREKFGASFEEMCDPNSDKYLLDVMVDKFNHDKDCNIADNDIWENVIEQIFNEL